MANDETYEICERYCDWAHVEWLKEIQVHNQHAGVLGWPPYEGESLKEAEESVAQAVKYWGSDFTEPYGWARPLFPNVRRRKVRFSDLGAWCLLALAPLGADHELCRRSLRSLERLVERDHGFRPDLTHYAISGLCAACRQAEAAGR